MSRAGCYTKRLHSHALSIASRGNRFYYRRRVPASLQAIIGKHELWRSLVTDSLSVAVRRSHQIAASVEAEFEAARLKAGLPTDGAFLPKKFSTSLSVTEDRRPDQQAEESGPVTQPISVSIAESAPTIKQVYDLYMTDPTRDWSPRTRVAYETTRRIVLSVMGNDKPVKSISRKSCRDLIEVLRWLPRNSSKLFPGKTHTEIAERARQEGRTDLISPANINTYINKFSGVLNWAVKEELMDRNPAAGLRVPDATLKRDKRLPFTMEQLRMIFAAPLYTGCQDDGAGYAKPGDSRPRNARFWVPLIGLFAGLRLNESCQLDVADIITVSDVPCFAVTALSGGELSDKRLKTASSQRLVPIHPILVDLGFLEFVAGRRRTGQIKLFDEITLGVSGYRSATFSVWFARFAAKAGVDGPKTCYHSFRHVFRDALREASIERDIALALGGWATSGGGSSSGSISDAYGSGYRIERLFDAIGKVQFPDLDLSHLYVRQDDTETNVSVLGLDTR